MSLWVISGHLDAEAMSALPPKADMCGAKRNVRFVPKADIPTLRALDPRVDLTSKRAEVDRLGEKRLCAALQCLALGLGIAIGGDHDHRDIRSGRLGLGQKVEPAHARHVDVGQDQDERHARRIGDALKGRWGRLGKLHGEPARPQIMAELLPEQQLNVRLIVDHKNEKAHALSLPFWQWSRSARQHDLKLGEHAGLGLNLNQSAMLLDDDVMAERQAKPGPFAGGLVVKNGLNILSFTSGGMPVPLSRILISTRSPRLLGRGHKGWLVGIAIGLRLALRRRIEAVRDQIEQHPGDLLGEHINLASRWIK